MSIPVHATPHRHEAVPILAALALGFGLVAAARLDTSGRLDLVLAAAGCIAVGVAVSQFSSSPSRALGASAIVAAAGIALMQSLLSLEGVTLDLFVWLLAIVGIVCSTQNRPSLPRFVLPSAAGVAFALPLLIERLNASAPVEVIQALAAVTACLAFSSALARITRDASGSPFDRFVTRARVPACLPAAALWCVSGATATASALSTDRGWTALTIFTIASVTLADSLLPCNDRENQPFSFPYPGVLTVGITAVAVASALAVSSAASGNPFGWPIVGAALVALVSLIALGNDLIAQGALDLAQLRRAARESRVDALTGLANRRGFDERLDEEIARASRFGHPLSLLLIDIDDFKQVNDRHGHAAGDKALEALSVVIDRSIRTIDIGARFGGEEFVVILPETSLEGAGIVAERIRLGVSEVPDLIPTTVSIGVADLHEMERNRDALLVQADTALYRAKQSGKNRVELVR